VVINVKYDEVERNMDIDLSGDEMGILIGKRGQTLDSLQYLVSLVVNKGEEDYIRVKVDTENYRQRRKETLENLAKNISYKVKRTKRPVSLEPMNPYERRIIHSALQNDKYVTTHSEGDEPFRRVVVNVEYKEDSKEMNIDLSGDDMGVLIGKRGQTLDSLQYLVSLVVNKESEDYVRVKVDTENYRKRRQDTLENLAKNIAFKVKRTKRTVSLEPMNPYERRIIHSALQNDKFVTTHSEGEEPFRHVVVTMKR
jgi:predicted RNA-binding protein Jag